jgi:hypothetical protein
LLVSTIRSWIPAFMEYAHCCKKKKKNSQKKVVLGQYSTFKENSNEGFTPDRDIYLLDAKHLIMLDQIQIFTHNEQ